MLFTADILRLIDIQNLKTFVLDELCCVYEVPSIDNIENDQDLEEELKLFWENYYEHLSYYRFYNYFEREYSQLEIDTLIDYIRIQNINCPERFIISKNIRNIITEVVKYLLMVPLRNEFMDWVSEGIKTHRIS